MTIAQIILAFGFLFLIILSIYTFIKSKKNEKDVEINESRIYNLMIMANCISFYCFFLINNFIFEYLQKNRGTTSFLNIISIIISWLPILIFIFIAFVYSLTAISDKFKNVLSYIYIHILTLIMVVFGIISVPILTSVMSKFSLNILTAVLFILSVIFQMISIKGMIKRKFNIKYEIKMLSKVGKDYESNTQLKKERKNIDKIYFLYIIVLLVNPHIYIFVGILIISLVMSIIFLKKMREEYLKFDYIKNKDITIFFFNYYICILLSVPAYFYHPILFFLILHAGRYTQFLLDNKIARKRYLEIENLNKE